MQPIELCNLSVFDTWKIFLSSSFPTGLERSGWSLINQILRTLLSLSWLFLQLSQQFDYFYSACDNSSYKSTWGFVFLTLQLYYRHLLIQKCMSRHFWIRVKGILILHMIEYPLCSSSDSRHRNTGHTSSLWSSHPSGELWQFKSRKLWHRV